MRLKKRKWNAIHSSYALLFFQQLLGYDNENSTLTLGYTNTIECTEKLHMD